MSVILRSVGKSFTDSESQSQVVLDNVSFEIATGSFVILRGASGTGKSTLLNIIAGLFLPDTGDVTVDDIHVNRLSEGARDRFRAARLGYIFQTFNLISALTALQNIYIPGFLTSQAGKPREEKEKAIRILESVGLGAESHNKYPYQLSVGQRQRVAVARTLFKNPPLVLADEPTASLDKESADRVTGALLEMKKRGTTVIIATHDPVFEALCPDMILNLEKREVGQ